MKSIKASRRDFLKAAAAASTSLAVTASCAQSPADGAKRLAARTGIDLLRRPDSISARFGMADVQTMQYTRAGWSLPGLRVSAEPAQQDGSVEVPVRVTSDGARTTFLHLRWSGVQSETMQCIGDAWERSYGDLEWRGTVPERMMPWYFLTHDDKIVNAYGVKTQPAAFCFWQSDGDGITLTIDLRNGGEPTLLGERELLACTIVTRGGLPGETIAHAAREFCRQMCPAPRLPKGALFGSNDWNYAYGKNTADGILRDADLIASLAPSGGVRPYIVIDDGYQDPSRFPDMAALASQIHKRQLKPGIWVRPMRAPVSTQASLLMPQARLGRKSSGDSPVFDPTVPEALDQAMWAIRTAVESGYEFIKHDFSTVELFGRWGSEMDTGPARPGWHFNDRSRTSAEIVGDLYRAMRSAAGERAVILGCNTVGHIAAGIFESQRIADDTSGREWERTRRFGVNGLAHRVAQHRTFSHIDPDCVAITKDVSWEKTSQWMDVVSRTGTSLFVSPAPEAITHETKAAIKEAFATLSEAASGFPSDPLEGTTPGKWTFEQPILAKRKYDWVGPNGTSPFLNF